MFDNELFIMYDKDFITREDIDNRLLLIIAFLRIRASGKGIIGTTIENIVKNIGYIPNRHKGKINDIIINQLKWLETNNYIFVYTDLNQLSQKVYFEIEINNDNNIFDMREKDNNGNVIMNELGEPKLKTHVVLTDKEFDKIVTTKTQINKSVLLRVFLNIKKRINFNDAAPKICYPSQALIAKDCCLNKGYSINKAIKELVNMGILFEHVTGGYKIGNKIINANNVYALDPKELKDANEIMLEYYNNKGIKINSFIPFNES
mgnify:CR=1 FL=1